ncbi:MAG: hypothetical protein NC218_01335 [Acetobacter sp.]|nr:hypothetical protein [Acetobacter sp.]
MEYGEFIKSMRESAMKQGHYAIVDALPTVVFTRKISTMATNAHNVFVNPDFAESLTPDERIGVFGHELFHDIFGHSSAPWAVYDRGSGLSKGQWHELVNVAMDIVVNDAVTSTGLVLPDGVCTREALGISPDLKTAHSIFTSLKEKLLQEKEEAQKIAEAMQQMAQEMADQQKVQGEQKQKASKNGFSKGSEEAKQERKRQRQQKKQQQQEGQQGEGEGSDAEGQEGEGEEGQDSGSSSAGSGSKSQKQQSKKGDSSGDSDGDSDLDAEEDALNKQQEELNKKKQALDEKKKQQQNGKGSSGDGEQDEDEDGNSEKSSGAGSSGQDDSIEKEEQDLQKEQEELDKKKKDIENRRKQKQDEADKDQDGEGQGEGDSDDKPDEDSDLDDDTDDGDGNGTGGSSDGDSDDESDGDLDDEGDQEDDEDDYDEDSDDYWDDYDEGADGDEGGDSSDSENSSHSDSDDGADDSMDGVSAPKSDGSSSTGGSVGNRSSDDTRDQAGKDISLDKIKKEMASAVSQQIRDNLTRTEVGSVPYQPVMPGKKFWVDQVFEYVGRFLANVKRIRTYQRPSRRPSYGFPDSPLKTPMKGQRLDDPKPRVMFYVDCSGSMGNAPEEIRQSFLRREHLLRETLSVIIPFATRLGQPAKLSQPLDDSSIGGGTNLGYVVSSINAQKGQFDLFVIVTDCDDGIDLGLIEKTKTVIVVTDRPNMVTGLSDKGKVIGVDSF